MDLFNENGFSTEEDKLPTINQYVKRMGNKKLPNRFHVQRIWFPNKYPNYSVETDKFRVSVSPRQPIGKALKNSLDALYDSDTSISVVLVLTESGKPSVKFVPTKETGKWVYIRPDSPMGISFEMD